MKFYHENERDLPVSAETEVLVCGCGPAGVGAAIAAARLGAHVTAIEMQSCLGGIATAGMMSHWGGRSSSFVLPEIYARQREKAKTMGGFDENQRKYVDDGYATIAINHEEQKIILDEMFAEAGVKVLFNTFVVGAIVENNRVNGVIIENKSGRSVIKARYTVDATGDGDVAANAGVPFFKGRETDGLMQPATLMFKIGGVDYTRAVFPGSFETKVYTEKGDLQSLALEKLPHPAGHVLLYPSPAPGVVVCNMTNVIGVDGTEAQSLSDSLATARSQIEPIIKFLKEYAPGYENCYILGTASLMGVRETRHFEGVSSLIPEDILTARRFGDWVVNRAFFNFDVHNLTGASLDKTGVQKEWKQDTDYTIPYGCLLPKKIDGLLLSGRNISGSHLAHSNFRIMSVCLALGEAAGTAAVLAAKKGVECRELSAKDIQPYLGE